MFVNDIEISLLLSIPDEPTFTSARKNLNFNSQSELDTPKTKAMSFEGGYNEVLRVSEKNHIVESLNQQDYNEQ